MKIMRKNKTSAFLGDGQEEMRNCIRIIDNIKESEGHLNIIDDFIQSKNGEKNEKKINSNFKLEIFYGFLNNFVIIIGGKFTENVRMSVSNFTYCLFKFIFRN